ncbi:hypothetical protein [Fusibacter ferrireducens]|uniref:Transposase n=1 Tax=Fusibacter ferrireducens TaxID=2785058 RepID=A0ABR9ZX88_9FIRM|nr:hypothetical protein [Fusibacter ferrireducens]MBF4695078.1 hypothetical protein [Fusibacter ferrireducens]
MKGKKTTEMTETQTVTTFEAIVQMPKGILDELRMYGLEWLDEAHVDLGTGEVTLSVSMTHGPTI